MQAASHDELVKILKGRFGKNMRRHTGIEWGSVQSKLDAAPERPQALYEMERTGGEPDVVGYDEKSRGSGLLPHPWNSCHLHAQPDERAEWPAQADEPNARKESSIVATEMSSA